MSEQKPSSPEWDAIVQDAKNLFVSVKKGINKLIETYGKKNPDAQIPTETKAEASVQAAKEISTPPNEVPSKPSEQPAVPNEQTPTAPQVEVPPPVTPTEPELKSPAEEGAKTDSDAQK